MPRSGIGACAQEGAAAPIRAVAEEAVAGAGHPRLDRASDRDGAGGEELVEPVPAKLDAHARPPNAAAEIDLTKRLTEHVLDRFDQGEVGGRDRDAGLDPARQAGRRRQLGEIVKAELPGQSADLRLADTGLDEGVAHAL